tara:strand:- start:257 stop:466 length:210 start_codon:yes stop_codon:yes gene_type:complete
LASASTLAVAISISALLLAIRFLASLTWACSTFFPFFAFGGGASSSAAAASGTSSAGAASASAAGASST